MWTSGTLHRSRASQPTWPGEPVVRVDDVVVARLVLGLLAQHRGGERAELGGQLLLAEALERAGADVPDGDAGAHLDDGRQVAGRGAGEDVDGDAAGGQAAGDLDDVDVHAAGVARAGLVERAGVHREGRHPPGRAGAGETANGHVQPPARIVRWPGATAPLSTVHPATTPGCGSCPVPIVPTPPTAPLCPARVAPPSSRAPRAGSARRPRPGWRPTDSTSWSAPDGSTASRRWRPRSALARCRWTSPTRRRWRPSPVRWIGWTCWSTTPAGPSTRPRSPRRTWSRGRGPTTSTCWAPSG